MENGEILLADAAKAVIADVLLVTDLPILNVNLVRIIGTYKDQLANLVVQVADTKTRVIGNVGTVTVDVRHVPDIIILIANPVNPIIF